MATAYSTATAIPQHAPYQQHAYRKSGQYSPTGSAMHTPANVSPTSPRTTHLPLARHQGIYQPRTAIGIPAALRKTEKPSSKSPPKVDSGVSSPNSGWNINGPFGGANDGTTTPVSQIGNEDLQSLYNDGPMSPVAGPITRNHWQVCISHLLFPMPLLASTLRSVACPEPPKWSALTYMVRVGPSSVALAPLPLSASPRCRALRNAILPPTTEGALRRRPRCISGENMKMLGGSVSCCRVVILSTTQILPSHMHLASPR